MIKISKDDKNQFKCFNLKINCITNFYNSLPKLSNQFSSIHNMNLKIDDHYLSSKLLK